MHVCMYVSNSTYERIIIMIFKLSMTSKATTNKMLNTYTLRCTAESIMTPQICSIHNSYTHLFLHTLTLYQLTSSVAFVFAVIYFIHTYTRTFGEVGMDTNKVKRELCRMLQSMICPNTAIQIRSRTSLRTHTQVYVSMHEYMYVCVLGLSAPSKNNTNQHFRSEFFPLSANSIYWNVCVCVGVCVSMVSLTANSCWQLLNE